MVRIYGSGIPKPWLVKLWCYELFLILGQKNGDPDFGIYDYYEMLKIKSVSQRTFTHFIGERVAAGDLILVPSSKGTRRSYKLNDDLKEKFYNSVN